MPPAHLAEPAYPFCRRLPSLRESYISPEIKLRCAAFAAAPCGWGRKTIAQPVTPLIKHKETKIRRNLEIQPHSSCHERAAAFTTSVRISFHQCWNVNVIKGHFQRPTVTCLQSRLCHWI